jgi:tRNA (Thr-GGU) A37 N-methylase
MHPIFPTDSEGNVKIKPIGHVKIPIGESNTQGTIETVTEIIINDACAKCLDGIEEFSHVLVVYWLDRIKTYREVCRPQGKDDVPLLGLLATR